MANLETHIPESGHGTRLTPVEALGQTEQPRGEFRPADGPGQLQAVVEPHRIDSVLSLDGRWAMCSCGANDLPTAELDDAKAWECDRAALAARHAREVAENERRIERKRLALERALADVRIQLLSRA